MMKHMETTPITPEAQSEPTGLEKNIARWKVISGQELTAKDGANLGGEKRVDQARKGWERWQVGETLSKGQRVALGGQGNVVRLQRLRNFDVAYRALTEDNQNLTDEQSQEFCRQQGITEEDLAILAGVPMVEKKPAEEEEVILAGVGSEQPVKSGLPEDGGVVGEGQEAVVVENRSGEALERVRAEMVRREREESFAGRFGNFMQRVREEMRTGAEAVGRVAREGWEGLAAAGERAEARLMEIRENVGKRIEQSRAVGRGKRRERIEGEILGLEDTINRINNAERTPKSRDADRGWMADYYQSRVDRLDRKLQRMDARRREVEDNARVKLSLAERLSGWINPSRLQATQA